MSQGLPLDGLQHIRERVATLSSFPARQSHQEALISKFDSFTVAQAARSQNGEYFVSFRLRHNPEDGPVELPSLTRQTQLGTRIADAIDGLAIGEQVNIMPGSSPENDVFGGAPTDFPPHLPNPNTQFFEVHNIDFGAFYSAQK